MVVGLAGAVGAQQAEAHPLGDAERHAGHRRDGRILLDELADFEDGAAHGISRNA